MGLGSQCLIDYRELVLMFYGYMLWTTVRV